MPGSISETRINIIVIIIIIRHRQRRRHRHPHRRRRRRRRHLHRHRHCHRHCRHYHRCRRHIFSRFLTLCDDCRLRILHRDIDRESNYFNFTDKKQIRRL